MYPDINPLTIQAQSSPSQYHKVIAAEIQVGTLVITICWACLLTLIKGMWSWKKNVVFGNQLFLHTLYCNYPGTRMQEVVFVV